MGKSMVRAVTLAQTSDDFKANGKCQRCMALDATSGLTVVDMTAITLMTRRKDLGFIFGLMDVNMRDSGQEEISMVLVGSSIWMEESGLLNGLLVIESLGEMILPSRFWDTA